MRTDNPRGIRTIEALSPVNERVLIIWRNLSGDTHADERNLQEWFEARRTPGLECDILYVNGHQRLEALRLPGETWQLRQIEAHFEPLRCAGAP